MQFAFLKHVVNWSILYIDHIIGQSSYGSLKNDGPLKVPLMYITPYNMTAISRVSLQFNWTKFFQNAITDKGSQPA